MLAAFVTTGIGGLVHAGLSRTRLLRVVPQPVLAVFMISAELLALLGLLAGTAVHAMSPGHWAGRHRPRPGTATPADVSAKGSGRAVPFGPTRPRDRTQTPASA
jgi:hypothetical protein